MKLIRAACVLALFSCALAPARAAPAETMTFLVDDFPPFTVNDNGAATGPFPDLVQRTCAALKIACELKFHPWRRAQWLADQIALSRKKLSKEQVERFLASLHGLLDNGTAREIIQKYGLRPAF